MTKGFEEPEDSSQRKLAYLPISLEIFGWILHDTDRHYESCIMKDLDLAVDEVRKFREVGGRTIADLTPIDIGRWPEGLKIVSEKTGVKVVCGTAYYIDAFNPPDLRERTVDEITREFVRDITEGIPPNRIRAGIIGEVGVSEPWTQNERKVCVAAARAQLETGAPLSIHPGRSRTSPFQILDLLKAEGVDLASVILCHLDRTLDRPEEFQRLAGYGCYMEFDLFGLMSYYPAKLTTFPVPGDEGRAILLSNLIRAGYLEKLLISHDVSSKVRLTKYGGYGLAHIPTNVVPRLLKVGVSSEEIKTIIVSNPARALAFA